MSASDAVPDPGPEWSVRSLLNNLELKANLLYMREDELASFFEDIYIPEEDVADIRATVDREQKQRELINSRTRLQAAVRDKLISSWVDEHVHEPDLERSILKRQIDIWVRYAQTEHALKYLTDVLTLGIKKADKKQERLGRGDGGYWGHAFEVLKGLIRVVIVLRVFQIAETNFQTIVFAMLVLIYFSIVGTGYSDVLNLQQAAHGISSQFKRVRRLLREELTEDEREGVYNQEVEDIKIIGRSRIRMWIGAVFLSLVWLIAFAELMRVIL